MFYRGRICRSWYGKRSCELFQFDARTRQGFSLRGHRAETWNGEIGGKELGRDKKMEEETRGLVELVGVWPRPMQMLNNLWQSP